MDFEDWPFGDTWSLRGNKEIASRYEILERIGEGTFGEVFRARRRADSLIVAIKEIHNADSSWREVNALLLLDHPNVVRLHEYFVLGDNMALVLEYLPFDLYRVIRAGKGQLTEGEVKGWMVQILQGLAACHSASIVHRDIKPKNVLVSEAGVLKIADFGQARILQLKSTAGKGESCGSKVADNSTEGFDGPDGPDGHGASHHEGDNFPKFKIPSGTRSEHVLDTHRKHPGSQIFDPSGRYSLRDIHFGGGGQGGQVNASKGLCDEEKGISDSVLRIQSNQGESDVHGLPGSINVGHSVLADAVKDARNYFTVEEIFRSGAEPDGFHLLAMQRKEILRLQEAQNLKYDYTACSQATALHRGQTPNERVSFGNLVGEKKAQNAGFQSSGVPSGQHTGTRLDATDALDCMEPVDARQKTGVLVGINKKDDDFMHKLRRFIRKRTRGLCTDVDETIVEELKGGQWSGNKVGKETNDLQNESSSTAGARSSVAGNNSIPAGVGRATLDGVSNGKNLAQLSDKQEFPSQDCGALMRMQHHRVTNLREKDNDCEISDGTWKESLGNVQRARVERKPCRGPGSNGPLRDMAYFDGQELRTPTSIKKGQWQDDEYRGGEGTSYEVEIPKDHMNPWRLNTSRNVRVDAAVESRDRDGENVANLPDDLAIEMQNSNPVWTFSSCNDGGLNVYRPEEVPYETWAEGSQEPFKGVRSWEKMDRCDSALSEAEGTRWYGAPDFRFSYIDSKTAERPSNAENDVAFGSDEWDDSSVLRADYGGRSLEKTSERGYTGSEDEGSDWTTMVGTRWYKAPELLYGATKYDQGVDIWAAGCIFGELLGGKPIFPGTSDLDQLSRVVRVLGCPTESTWPGVSLLPDFDKISFDEDRPPLSLKSQLPSVPDLALEFLEKLLTYDPKSRPSAEGATDHSFFHTDPLPHSSHELQLPTVDESESSEEEWGYGREQDSSFSDFEILG